jgi:pyruvate/2-oxoglutarate dehydrogenase complex dihydrolipoamide dehydrogenase (E3) component
MPSKTLIATSDLAYEIGHSRELGIAANIFNIDFEYVMRRKREVVQGFAGYRIEGIAKDPLLSGHATFISPHRLNVDGKPYDAKAFLIATGSVVAPTAIPGLHEIGFIDSDRALELAARHERIDYALSKAHAIFTDPQIAIAGETEKDLQGAGIPYLAASAPFNDHGKAIAIGKTKGFAKLLARRDDGRIIGCAIVGPHASDLIHEVIVAMNYRATVFEFMRIPHLHPTMAEILTEPAEELAAVLSARSVEHAIAR